MSSLRLLPRRAVPRRANQAPSVVRHASTRSSSKTNTNFTWNRNRASSSTASASSPTHSEPLSSLFSYLTTLRPSALWARYNTLLRTHPLKTRMVTSGILFVTGDMISQHIIEQRPFGPGVWSDEAHAQGVEERREEGHVWIRTARLAFYGTIIFAPLSHNWLRLLERVKLHSKMSTVLAKVALDVSVWGAFIVGVFWTSNGILEGKTPPEIHEKVSHAYLPSWCKSVLVFGPSQLFNFSVIPVPHRMLFSQCVGLGWNTFLSFANNRSNAMLTRAVEDVERVEEALEHAVEKVEERVLAVAHKAGDALHAHTHTDSVPATPSSTTAAPVTRTATPPAPPPPASSYIASSPLEPTPSSTASAPSSDGTNTARAHVTPTLQRYDEIFADELEYQDALYPSIEDVPGCMTLFDEFLMCYALGPQIRQVYRYGTPIPCTHRMEDFKFCMSLKGESEDSKRKLWVRRRAEWWAGRRVAGSSEDVWRVRAKGERLVGVPPVVEDEVDGEGQMEGSVA